MIHPRRFADVDLLLLEHDRHRNHDRELLGVALKVARHREHGPIAVSGQHHLRRVVVELGVPLGDVEAAEGERARRGRREQEKGEGNPNEGEKAPVHRVVPIHGTSLPIQRAEWGLQGRWGSALPAPG